MKLTDLTLTTDIELSVTKKQEHEYKLIGSHVPKIDGYTIFEYNMETKEIVPAVYQTEDTFDLNLVEQAIKSANTTFKLTQSPKKLHLNKNCIYVEALNVKNAIKHLKNGNYIHKT